MEKISTTAALRSRIAFLEAERTQKEAALKQELQLAHEFVKPSNLVKHAVKDVFSSSELKGSFADVLLGLASGYLAKKAVTGSSAHPVKTILGGIIQTIVTGKVAEHAQPVRTAIVNAVNEFLNKEKKAE